MTRIDDPSLYAERDPRGFRELLRAMPAQIRDAAGLAEGVSLDGGPPSGVIVVGMGGSAIAGDLLQALCHERAMFPIQVVRGYSVPAWAGPGTVVVGSSYSGGTEETLTAFDAACARGARPLVITSGGALAARAARDGIPCVLVPKGLPPRAALAFLLMPLLTVLDRLGVRLAEGHERGEAIRVLEEWQTELVPEVPRERNPAKELGVWLHGRVPIVYGTDMTAAIAYRWRTQIEENAKVLAFSGALPELNHNSLEAWGTGTPGGCAVVLLRDPGESPRIARRAALTREIIAARAPTREVWARGHGRLARMLSLVLLGDWASYYLAVVGGTDPWTVETLERFKRRMNEGGRGSSSEP